MLVLDLAKLTNQQSDQRAESIIAEISAEELGMSTVYPKLKRDSHMFFSPFLINEDKTLILVQFNPAIIYKLDLSDVINGKIQKVIERDFTDPTKEKTRLQHTTLINEKSKVIDVMVYTDDKIKSYWSQFFELDLETFETKNYIGPPI